MKAAMSILAVLAVIGAVGQIPGVDDAITRFLEPTFADHPQDLEVRFEEMSPPRSAGADGALGAGIWKHRKPVDMDITFTASD